MKAKWILSSGIFLLLFSLLPGAELFRNGKGNSAIILEKTAPAATRLAAEELQKYLQKMTGTLIPIREPGKAGNKVLICIGENSFTKKQGYKLPVFNKSGYDIFVKGDLIVLAGPVFNTGKGSVLYEKLSFKNQLQALTSSSGLLEEDNGNMHAVTAFLEHLGVRFFAPGKEGTLIPVRKNIVLKDMRITKRAAFGERVMTPFGKGKVNAETLKWFRHLKMGSSNASPIPCAIADVLKKFSPKDHDWIARNEEGELLYTDDGFPCPRFTHKGFQKACVEYMRELLNKNPGRSSLQILLPGFRNGMYDSRDLKAWEKEYRYPDAHKDIMLSFYCNIAKEIRKSHPGKTLLCNTSFPKEWDRTLLPSNLLFFPYPSSVLNCSNPGRLEGYLKGLSTHFENTQKKKFPLKEFWNEYSFPHLPRQSFHAVHALQKYRQGQREFVSGIRMVPPLHSGKGTLAEPHLSHLMIYVNSRLLWDPDLDMDALMKEYCQFMFGPAAQAVSHYFTFGEHINARNGLRRIHLERGQLTLSDIDVALELLQKAKALTKQNSLYAKRIEKLEETWKSLKSPFHKKRPTGPAVQGEILPFDAVCDGNLKKYKNWHPLFSAGSKGKNRTFAAFSFTEDRKKLFVAFRCYEEEMKKLKGGKYLPDSLKILQEDHVKIQVYSPDASENFFAFNAKGSFLDGCFDPEVIKYNGHILASTRITKTHIKRFADRWEGEIAINMGGLGRKPDYSVFPWGLRLSRVRMVSGKREVFTSVPEKKGSSPLFNAFRLPGRDSKGWLVTRYSRGVIPVPGGVDESTYIIKRAKGKVDISAPWESKCWKDVPFVRMNWENVRYPRASFYPDTRAKIQYDDKNLYVLYQVKDKYVAGEYKNDQNMVCLDSCVELFIRPQGKGAYYNFETNCIGTLLLYECKFIGEKSLFSPLPLETLKKVKRFSTLPRDMKGEIKKKITWRVGLEIPLSIFKERVPDLTLPLKGQVWTGNFYKCADQTTFPCQMSWKKSSTFHAPEEFGTFIFE